MDGHHETDRDDKPIKVARVQTLGDLRRMLADGVEWEWRRERAKRLGGCTRYKLVDEESEGVGLG